MVTAPNSPDMQALKMNLLQKNIRMEEVLSEHVTQIRNSGFADQRLAQMAFSKFEEGWLLLEKSLRINASPTEYGKVPSMTPMPDSFKPNQAGDFDASVGDKNLPHGQIDWKDVGKL